MNNKTYFELTELEVDILRDIVTLQNVSRHVVFVTETNKILNPFLISEDISVIQILSSYRSFLSLLSELCKNKVSLNRHYLYVIISPKTFYPAVQKYARFIRNRDQDSPIVILHRSYDYINEQLYSYTVPSLFNIQHVYNMYLVIPSRSAQNKKLPDYSIHEVCQFCFLSAILL